MLKRQYLIKLTEIENIIDKIIINGGDNKSLLIKLKNSINDFFDDAICTDVIYTDNKDGIFFGMCVYEYSTFYKYTALYKNENYKPNYIIELDSRLFSEELDLNSREITAFLLHEIGHIICSKSIDKDTKDMFDMTAIDNDFNDLKLNKINMFSNKDTPKLFFDYAIYLTKRKMYSIFEQNREEFIADDFVISCGYGNHLSSGFKKILKNRKWALTNPANSGVALVWAFNTFKFMETREQSIQYQINAIESSTGSKVEKDLINKMRKIARNKGFVIESYQCITDYYKDNVIKEFNIIRNMRAKGINKLEDDLYEYNIRLKNLESEAQALDMIRDVNYKINIIKEFMEQYPDYYAIDEVRELLNKYIYIREEISKTQIYKDKYYGLFVEIPKVKGRYEL